MASSDASENDTADEMELYFDAIDPDEEYRKISDKGKIIAE